MLPFLVTCAVVVWVAVAFVVIALCVAASDADDAMDSDRDPYDPYD